MELLDMKCAECGEKIAKISNINETLITKSLGVLQENGVYAFYLYLCSRGSKESEPGMHITQETFRLLKDRSILTNVDSLLENINFNEKNKKQNYSEKLLNAIRPQLSDQLEKILLAKELLERTLVYARYHTKALGNEKSPMEKEEGGE